MTRKISRKDDIWKRRWKEELDRFPCGSRATAASGPPPPAADCRTPPAPGPSATQSKVVLQIRIRIRIRIHCHKYGSGSGSFHHQATKLRKTLISTVSWLLFDFLSVFRIRIRRIRMFLGLPDPHPDSYEDPDSYPDPYQNVTDPQHWSKVFLVTKLGSVTSRVWMRSSWVCGRDPTEFEDEIYSRACGWDRAEFVDEI